jgi:hypothetical protein
MLDAIYYYCGRRHIIPVYLGAPLAYGGISYLRGEQILLYLSILCSWYWNLFPVVYHPPCSSVKILKFVTAPHVSVYLAIIRCVEIGGGGGLLFLPRHFNPCFRVYSVSK